MALTRAMLKAMGIETEKIDEIIAAHSETVEGLKTERDSYKDKATEYEKLETEVKTLREKTKEDWQKKYEDEHSAFDAYKTEQANKDALTAKTDAYKAMLKTAGVSEKRIDSIIRVTDLSNIEVADGKLKGEKELIESVKKDWADFIVTQSGSGAKENDPPAPGGTPNYDAMSDDDYYKATYEASKKK